MKHPFNHRMGLVLLACSSLLVSAFSTTNKLDDDTVVTLYVNTAEIKKPNESAYCNFGQTNNVSNEEFTIAVNVGETVTWRGVSSNAPGTDVVEIKAINHMGGKNVFGTNVLNAERGEGTVSAKVLYPTNGNNYKYKISFTVTNNGTKKGGTFSIDPKIEVH